MDVSNELPSTDFDRLVGIEAHVAKMQSLICLESDEVKIVGIWGPAGIGKTTIARALYKQVSCNFQLKFYKENLEGKYKMAQLDTNDLQVHLRKELLSGVLDHKDMKIEDLLEAEVRLKHQRVLLILDDISSQELQALANIIQCLRFGSKVIVTSEDIYKLKTNGIHQIYKVDFPSREEALQILSYSAFGQKSPPRGYLEQACEIAQLVAPFPLGLKVLGSSLRGKSKDEWMMRLPTLRTFLGDKNISKVIRFAYDSLSLKHKTLLFKLADIVLWGKKVNTAIYSLAERDWDVEEGIQNLADLGLISISSGGGIIMHYVVQYIVRMTYKLPN